MNKKKRNLHKSIESKNEWQRHKDKQRDCRGRKIHRLGSVWTAIQRIVLLTTMAELTQADTICPAVPAVCG
jgi:hypothetical protein